MIFLEILLCYALLLITGAWLLPGVGPGAVRLLAACPALATCVYLPFCYDKAVLTGSVAFLFTWLAAAKLLSLCMGRGPLALKGLTVVQRAALLLLPLQPDEAAHQGVKPTEPLPSPLTISSQAAGAVAIMLLVQTYTLPNWQKHILYALVVWLVVCVLLDAATPAATQLLALPPSCPSMDQPYLSSSLGDFWGRRYNRVVSYSLRHSVYQPLLEGSTGWLGSYELRKGLATVAAFAVSGIMHEMCIWYMCRTYHVAVGTFIPGRMAAFFLVQAPAVLLERAAWRAVSSRPWAAALLADPGQGKTAGPSTAALARLVAVGRTLAVFGYLFSCAELTFWPALESCKVDVNGIAEVADALRAGWKLGS